MTEITDITREHRMWVETAEYAEKCPWNAGKKLAEMMRKNKFEDFERVFIAVKNERIIGFCTLTKKDALPDKYLYSPFIGYVFVDEGYRGKRVSQKMIEYVRHYARISGFGRVYITSGEVGLYEKYGFRKLGIYETVYGTSEQLFVIDT